MRLAPVRIIDLSHPIEHGMTTYPGLPGPEVSDHLTREESRGRYSPGTEFRIGRISMVANTGTYLDTPAHRYADGTGLVTTPLDRMVELDAVTVEAVGAATIDVDHLRGRALRGRAVLLHTGWSRHWRTERYFNGHPYLTASAASYLVAEGVVLVGIDSLNIDATDSGERPAHSTLLAAGIPVVEHLCQLDRLPAHGYRFSAAALPIVGLGTSPVRAYAVVDEPTLGQSA